MKKYMVKEKCGSKPHESGRGNIFMPLVTGYMLGSMLNQPKGGPAPVGPAATQADTRRGGFGGQAPRFSSAGS